MGSRGEEARKKGKERGRGYDDDGSKKGGSEGGKRARVARYFSKNVQQVLVAKII